MSRPRVAITGTGYIADYHARAVATAGGELVAAVNHRAESLAALAERYGFRRQYLDIDALLADGDIDALIVATPNVLHAEQATKALEAGIPVLLEKPMAMTVAESAAIAAAESGPRARVMLAHCLRFDEQVRWVRDLVRDGTLGRPVHTTAYAVHAGFGPGGWFTDPVLAGGGAMLDLGVHAIDASRFVLGDPQPLRVTARIGTFYRELPVDDTAILTIDWDNGTSSSVEAGWWHPYAPGPSGSVHVCGTEAYAQTFPGTLVKTGAEPEAQAGFSAELTETALQQRYDGQMRAFFELVREGAHPSPDAADGITSMQIIEAAYKSAAEGQTVYLGRGQ
ncbi:Gfo/Idh/MocA family protein [Sinosporangium siamense]|uniref:Oxidoreductase n=1 Tax=Sinosporangium siamense TaxID=1367973 RepID=A0A919RP63_9ACTN|nr:Gfo/Idh/MocA family oxidoreductase [Sinosporangium siamense]GII97375.1 oxidoreductase [Sinosporangium siamense]